MAEPILNQPHFQDADAACVMSYLPLEVAQLNSIIINHPDSADACGCKIVSYRTSKPSCADDKDLCIEYLLLSLSADLRQDYMAAVSL